MTSPEPTGTWTIDATEGTPWSSTRNTMYQPGGARLPFAGASTVNAPLPRVKLSDMKRWSWSTLWVSDPIRTRDTEAIRAASGVSTVNGVPYLTTPGAPRSTAAAPCAGRAARRAHTSARPVPAKFAPLPERRTLPSGSSNEVWWYMREIW